MLRDEYEGVVEDMRLKDGLAWSLPVTVSVDEEQARELSENSEIALVDGTGEPVATMVLRSSTATTRSARPGWSTGRPTPTIRASRRSTGRATSCSAAR